MGKKIERKIKCPGRFQNLREYLYNDVLPIVVEGRTLITEEDLKNAWELMKDDIWNFGQKDPYYNSQTDSLRKQPNLDYLSLVPLIESPAYSLERGCINDYSLSMGNDGEVSKKLESMSENPLRFFREILRREPKTVVFPHSNNKNLVGYIITADTGVGTVTRGGILGGGVRSDSPFILGIHHQEGRSELNLASIIGFWAQDNKMIVSQMQSCKNARLPEGVKFGEACLYLAEIAAREMGFKVISTYNARDHPIFKEHPDDWKQFGRDFVCMYDNSAKKLKYDGSRNSHHSLSLTNH